MKLLGTQVAKIRESLKGIEMFRRTLDEEELKAILPRVIEFYDEHADDRQFFNDGSRDYVFIQSPEESNENKPKEIKSKFSEGKRFMWWCKCKIGSITVFLTQEQALEIGWDSIACIVGRLQVQYKPTDGEKRYFKSLKALAEYLQIDEDELDDDDFFRVYNINADQVIV